MASDLVRAPWRRRAMAELIDAMIMVALTDPFELWFWRARRIEAQETKARQAETRDAAGTLQVMKVVEVEKADLGACPAGLSRPRQRVDWWRPRKPGKRFWVRLGVTIGYERLTLGRDGRTVGQRLLGLRTVSRRTGAPPGWKLLAVKDTTVVLRGFLPAGVRLASLPVHLAWWLTHSRRPADDTIWGLVVVDDSGCSGSRWG